MRDPTKRLEGEIQAAIIAYCTFRKDMAVWRNNSGGFRPKSGGFVRFGLGKKGSADIICCIKPGGRMVGIECKQEGEYPTAEQKEWGEELEKFGGLYIVARSVKDVDERLLREGYAGAIRSH